jgi:hypothetical protein
MRDKIKVGSQLALAPLVGKPMHGIVSGRLEAFVRRSVLGALEDAVFWDIVWGAVHAKAKPTPSGVVSLHA